MRLIARRFMPLVALSLAIPALAGYLLSGTLAGAATGLSGVGWYDLFRSPHHLERQLRLPFPRQPPL